MRSGGLRTLDPEMHAAPLTAEQRDALRYLIDRATRERVGNPNAIVMRPCRTEGCQRDAKTHRGVYAGLCDDCIASLGYHLRLDGVLPS